MNIYKITQTINKELDTFDGAVVIAKSAEEARLIHPAQVRIDDKIYKGERSWSTPENVHVEYLGELDNNYLKHNPNEVNILSSFNEG